MGQKINPISFRLGYIRSWGSLWFAKKKDFADQLLEDIRIREHIKKGFKQSAISSVVIERASERIRVNIHTARPGVIIGRKGVDIDRLRDELTGLVGKEVLINIHEVKNPALDAQLVSENVALQLERRIAFRRAMKKSIQQTIDAGALGIKVCTKGRLGGSEIARDEWYRVGSVPLQTLRADVDYGFSEAMTSYGKIGVKVWIYKGEIIDRPNLFNIYGKNEKPQSRKGAGSQGASARAKGKKAEGSDEPEAKPAAETGDTKDSGATENAEAEETSSVTGSESEKKD